MQALKVRKIGNSLGLVLPKETLAGLGVGENDILYITRAAEDSYRITPYNEEFSKQMQAAEDIMKEDRDLLQELASR